ncbi:MAG: hypothetical protein ACI9BD_000673 [Candidatus Marinamargulisbacteria bacterium]|jgi:hypothetical protein
MWIWIWKTVLLSGLIAFAVLSLFVIIGGYRDISTLFEDLRKDS